MQSGLNSEEIQIYLEDMLIHLNTFSLPYNYGLNVNYPPQGLVYKH